MSIEGDIEQTATDLARAAGERIASAYGKALQIQFKAAMAGAAANSNPVSEVDHDVESLIRRELAARFPAHDVIGEEKGGAPRPRSEFTWVIDPLDGTTNFINGLPLFACSIGVLREGRPFAGAIWCVSSHQLRAGVYHARRGGVLCFEGEPVERRQAAQWRGIVALPREMSELGAYWDVRVLGSATIELAFVSAGLLRLTYIAMPGLWDAAAGVVLAEAAGCAVMTRQDAHWTPLTRFEPLDGWSQPLLVGDPASVDQAVQAGGVRPI